GEAHQNVPHAARVVALIELGLRRAAMNDPDTMRTHRHLVSRQLEAADAGLRRGAEGWRVGALVEGAVHVARLQGMIAGQPSPALLALSAELEPGFVEEDEVRADRRHDQPVGAVLREEGPARHQSLAAPKRSGRKNAR